MAEVFTGGELSRWLDAGTLEKGNHQVSAVRELRYRSPLLTAQVEGWQVAIDLDASTRTPHSPCRVAAPARLARTASMSPRYCWPHCRTHWRVNRVRCVRPPIRYCLPCRSRR